LGIDKVQTVFFRLLENEWGHDKGTFAITGAIRPETRAIRPKILAIRPKILAIRPKILAIRPKILANRPKIFANRPKILANRPKILANRPKNSGKFSLAPGKFLSRRCPESHLSVPAGLSRKNAMKHVDGLRFGQEKIAA
jgi:hypothetical protein